MRVGTSTNEYGIIIGKYKCDTCGEQFTVCPDPHLTGDDEHWQNCLSKGCPSYDINRDLDLMWDDPELYKALHGDVKLIPINKNN